MADVIEKAKELAESIQQDPRCHRMQVARAANDADPALQHLIGEFNLKKLALSRQYKTAPDDKEKIGALEDEIRTLYAKIMEDPGMKEYAAAKEAMDELNAQINAIIQLAVTGEVPDGGSCSGNCEGCAGCR